MKDERGLSVEQINALQKAAFQYGGKLNKQDLLDNFRRLGYLVNLFE